MKLLHLDSSILGANSVSRSLSAGVVDRFRSMEPDIDVTYRDLVAEPIGHLDGPYFAALRSDAPRDPAIQEDMALGDRIMEEFLAADTVVIGVAFYNFGVPSQLKTWIDRIVIAGKTFRYGPRGVEGLAGDKRVVLAVARGGFYGPGSRLQSFQHDVSYLRSVLAFIGISNPEVVMAEGVGSGPQQREAAVAKAFDEIGRLGRQALPASA